STRVLSGYPTTAQLSAPRHSSPSPFRRSCPAFAGVRAVPATTKTSPSTRWSTATVTSVTDFCGSGVGAGFGGSGVGVSGTGFTGGSGAGATGFGAGGFGGSGVGNTGAGSGALGTTTGA